MASCRRILNESRGLRNPDQAVNGPHAFGLVNRCRSYQFSSVTPLEEFLENRDPRDLAPLVERLYRFLPHPLARLSERCLQPRHMRSIAPAVSFIKNNEGGWTVRHGTRIVAQGRPLEGLVGTLNQPVTIVATGPSAKDHDWDRVRDGGRFVIAVAGAPTFLKERGVRPDLYVVSDSRFARYGIAQIRNAPGVPLVTVLRAASFLANESREELVSRPFALIEKINSWYGLPRLPYEALLDLNRRSGAPFHFPESLDPHYRIGWSHAPELGFFSAATVVFVALQIAVRLGARDIEIVGRDLSGASRAYDEGGKPVRNTLGPNYEPVILPSFMMMHEALKDSGVSIRNLSPVCPLPQELFPQVRSC